MSDRDITKAVIEEFIPLAEIPRPSGHEKAVSDYLLKRLQSFGIKTVQDERYNIIADMPASAGREGSPVTILQAHMDMVCVAEPGIQYDPFSDAIKVKYDENFLWAEGTSLGADDGIGIAEILFILRDLKKHGPIRVIFTVDEECGMIGAISLESKCFANVKYLINCDSEAYDVLTVGSAGSVDLDFSRKITYAADAYKKAYCLEVKGLLGGHSGEEINKGRGNAIEILARVLTALQDDSVEYALASISGGKARNAIPAQAMAIIVSDESELKLQQSIAAFEKSLLTIYEGTDANLTLAVNRAELPPRVISSEDKEAILSLLLSLHTGVYAMSQIVPGLVESSANLGRISEAGGTLTITFYPRSAVAVRLLEFCQSAKAVAGLAGFSLEQGSISPSWQAKTGKLAEYMTEEFFRQNGKPMKVVTIHAGLECGWYSHKNPDMDMVSVGATTYNIHSPKEKLDLRTVAPQVRLIKAVLERIADE